jgi:tetratricopeptide (TPR) repeat protein
MLAVLVLPSGASAQRDEFFNALLPFYRALAGVYGDEGAQLTAHVETLATTLSRWDAGLGATEIQLRARLKDGNPRTALEVHTVLASLYAERSRFRDAIREVEADLTIDPKRVVFHRFMALLQQADGKPAAAASSFRSAWLLDPADPQNAYHLLVRRSDETTDAEIERALATLAAIETELTKSQRGAVESPFLTLNSINDDVGTGMAFVPGPYARGFEQLLGGQFEAGMDAIRAAVAADPLVSDPVSRSEQMASGIAALRQGLVDQAIRDMSAAVAKFPASSEAQRLLGTSYGLAGNTEKSLQHLREAVRLNPRDERSWIGVARVHDVRGEREQAVELLRRAVAELPDSGALRWMLSVASGKRQRTDESDLELISAADRIVVLAGKGELYGRVARLAQAHLDYDRGIDLLERRVRLTPNNAAAHKTLGRAYMDQGREQEGYAELVIALWLDTMDAETLTTLGRLHVGAGRFTAAIDALTRAVALEPANVQAVHGLGEALVRAGRTAEGQAQLEESERLRNLAVEDQRRQRTSGMLALQAEIDTREGQHDRAIETWRRVIELEGTTSANLLRLAEALFAAKRFEQAAEQILMAIAQNAGPDAHRRLAEVYAAMGRGEESTRARATYVQLRLEQLSRSENP